MNATENDLIYVGHSMGTTMNFVLLSEKPEYNDKIRLFVALAPVAYMSHIKSPIRFLAPFSKEYEVKFLEFLFQAPKSFSNLASTRLLQQKIKNSRAMAKTVRGNLK